MPIFLLKRILSTIPVMLIVAVLVFMLLRLTPGDPAAIIAGDAASPENIAKIREGFGLDKPLPVQFGIWFGNLLTGNLGESYFFKKTVVELIAQRIEPTLALATLTILIAIAVAVPLGVLAAWRMGGWLDRALMGFSVMGFSVPVFVLAYILIYIALIARVTRAAVSEVLTEDYIRTARAKGLPEFTVLWRHAFANAAVPIVTVIGIGIALLIGGVVVTESVYGIPGLGRLTVDAVLARDFPTIQGVILLFSFVYVLINLAVDLSYVLFDPRIRY